MEPISLCLILLGIKCVREALIASGKAEQEKKKSFIMPAKGKK